MLYTFDYDAEYSPSMPVVVIRIGKPHAAPGLAFQAVVDSGADATIIPVRWLREIGAHRSKNVWMHTPGGSRRLVDLYYISLRVATHERHLLRVVGGLDTEEAILGRDVLNHLIVTLNGWAGATEISE